MIPLAEELAKTVGVVAACQALRIPRNRVYQSRQPVPVRPEQPVAKSTSPRALSPAERDQVSEALNSERFQDQSPREVYATLLDEGKYLCSPRSMYRILEANHPVRERRNQLRHPNYARPELLATQPNQLWSWDITKLKGPVKWTYYYLYVILDVFSRYVVGWLIAERESASLAQELIATTCARQNIQLDQLTIHADRGSAMTSKSVTLLMSDLGVTKTHSRPHVSNDNPFSEAQFKTLKYRPDYPGRFGCQLDARSWAQPFFQWYNYDHHHSSLGLLTPADVHFGQAPAVLAKRQEVLAAAYASHPERFVKGFPKPLALPETVWINPPKSTSDSEAR